MRRHPSRFRLFTRLLVLALGAALLGGTLAPAPAQAQPRPMIEVRVCKTAGTDVPAQTTFDFTIEDSEVFHHRTIRPGECASVMVWDGAITIQETVPPGYAVTSITADKEWQTVDRNLRLARARFFAFGDEGRLWTITFHNALLTTATSDEAQSPPPDGDPPPTAFDWGIHANGWYVCIRNNSREETLGSQAALPTDNVAERPSSVGLGKDDCTLRGQSSIFGGPANISFGYGYPDYSRMDGAGIAFRVHLASAYPRGTTPAFDFGCVYLSFNDPPATCTVVRGTMHEPIFVIFEPKPVQ